MKIKFPLIFILFAFLPILACGVKTEKTEQPEVIGEELPMREDVAPLPIDEEPIEKELKPAEEPISEEITCETPAPGFNLPDIDGNRVSLSDFAGKVVLIDFWAVWCGPCRIMIPGLIELQNQYRDAGLVVLGISVDQQRNNVPGFVRREGINYPIVFHDRNVVMAYGNVSSIPTTFVVDRNGCIRHRLVGAHSKAQLERVIRPLLGETVAIAEKQGGAAEL
ncbi:MAG TPA: TlpA family protein disulfide reductase [candidate division Zixibacteria bacterium]|nr:TlpA family protein disulfide reductase [candidate division Zixibacteria bacterium]